MRSEIIGDHEHELIEVTSIEDFSKGILKFICRYCDYKKSVKIINHEEYTRWFLKYKK